MKDEIKEILENIKRHLDYVETIKQASIRDNQIKVMYDYIINLQEEKERLHNLIVQHIDKEDNLIDYKSIIDNAIEYINSIIENTGPDLYNDDLDDLYILLNILQGSDE